MLFDSPVAELLEENESSMVHIDFLESSRRVIDLDSPLGELRANRLEFLRRYSSIFGDIDFIEGNPELVILSQRSEEEGELGFRNIVITVGAICFESCFRCGESSEDNWLEIEKDRDVNDIPKSFVDLGKTEIAISIDINQPPVFISGSLVLRSVLIG